MATNNWMTPLGGTTTGGPTQPPDVLWDPSQLSVTKGWFAGDAVSGVSNGGSVSLWSNAVSGYGDLTTAASSSPPTLDTNALNSKPVLRFDGTQALSNTGWDNSTTDEYTLFVVFKRLGDNGSAATAGVVYLGDGNPISGIIGYNISGYSNPYRLNNNFSGGTYDSGFGSTSVQSGWFIASSTRTNDTGGYTNVFINGSLEAQKSSTGSLALSNNIALGQWTSTYRFDGQIAEFIYLNAAATTADREKIEGYLAHKWGLTANLPTNHPYKSSPPVWAQISGGTETFADGYKYSTFTSGSTLTASTGGVVEYLIVGGGGGGASTAFGGGGGGGAGGLLSGTAAVTPQSYTITVGAGGAGTPASSVNTDGVSGGNSAAFGLTATGGGGGGFFRGGGLGGGLTGGSGGGAGGNRDGTRAGGTGTVGQGNDGSTGLVTSGVGSQSGGGGGGGAGSAGSISTTSVGGAGGVGAEWPTGSGTYYAAGGQAGHGNNSTTVVSGAANTGNGGTGSQFPTAAGNGGSGIVIVRSKVWAQASGGTETTSGGYKYHTFTSGGTLTVSSAGSVEYCIVAGGGGGGRGNGGSGGGAGGMLTGTASLSAQSYTITVGAGGADRTVTNGNGNNGQNSTFAGSGFTTLTAIGGGGGAGANRANGSAGGSGGGAAWNDPAGVPGSGTAGQGNNGGAASTPNANGGGCGGGGAGAAGGPMVYSGSGTNYHGGDGGDGLEWPAGSGTYYAGGGGGTRNFSAGTHGSGGTGGGGDGFLPGTANTGGGGGGKPSNDTYNCAGGSGIVIVRYKV